MPCGKREPRLLAHVARLAVDRDEDLRPHPAVHRGELGPPGMARDVDVRLALGDDQHAEVAQRVHDPADGDLVAGDLLRREDHRVALDQLELVIAERDPAERGARLALPAGGDDQHFAARQAHRLVEADRLGEIAQIAGRLRDPEDAVEARPATHSLRPVSIATRPIVCSRAALEAKVVTSTRPLALRDLLEQPGDGPPLRDPTAVSWKTLVELQTSASTPSSPIAVSVSAGSTARRAPASSSSFQSPVWKTLPNGRLDQQRHCPRGSSGRAGRR